MIIVLNIIMIIAMIIVLEDQCYDRDGERDQWWGKWLESKDKTCKYKPSGNTEIHRVDAEDDGLLLIASHLPVRAEIKKP